MAGNDEISVYNDIWAHSTRCWEVFGVPRNGLIGVDPRFLCVLGSAPREVYGSQFLTKYRNFRNVPKLHQMSGNGVRSAYNVF